MNAVRCMREFAAPLVSRIALGAAKLGLHDLVLAVITYRIATDRRSDADDTMSEGSEWNDSEEWEGRNVVQGVLITIACLYILFGVDNGAYMLVRMLQKRIHATGRPQKI